MDFNKIMDEAKRSTANEKLKREIEWAIKVANDPSATDGDVIYAGKRVNSVTDSLDTQLHEANEEAVMNRIGLQAEADIDAMPDSAPIKIMLACESLTENRKRLKLQEAIRAAVKDPLIAEILE